MQVLTPPPRIYLEILLVNMCYFEHKRNDFSTVSYECVSEYHVCIYGKMLHPSMVCVHAMGKK